MIEALWGRLPVISNGGDVISDLVEQHKLGVILKDKDPKKAAKTIINIKPSLMKDNIDKFIINYTWDKLIDPIDNFCNNPIKDKSKKKFLFNKKISAQIY